MILNCYVVDDELRAATLLGHYIEKTDGLQLQAYYTNPLTALAEAVNWPSGSLIFMDIDMPELSGLALARLSGRQHFIIFTTAFREYGPEAFEQQAADYLLKPFTYERFLQAIQHIRGKITLMSPLSSETIYVKTGNKGALTRINLDDIRYISGLSNYVEVFLSRERVITYLTLKELEKQLPEKHFSRINKSVIVGHGAISRIETDLVILGDGTNFTLGKPYRERFLGKINPLLLSSSRS
jgi:DNA-binding LytR/AlgR family response regulator